MTCACPKCVAMCRNPGWFAPDEAKKAIDAGLAKSLMLDYLTGDPNVYVLAPASVGREGQRARNTSELFGGRSLFSISLSGCRETKGQCVLFKDDRCSIHDSGYKPKQCRENYGCRPDGDLDNYAMAAIWDNAEAQHLCREWMRLVSLDEAVLEECF